MRALDAALLAVFVPLWGVCFALHLKELALGRLAWVPVTVTRAPDTRGFPAVRGFWPDAEPGALRVGDRLLHVGEFSLAGEGPLGFLAATYAAAAGAPEVSVELARDGERREATFALRPVGVTWRLPLTSLGFALPGILVLLRRPGSRAVRAFFLAAMAYALHWTFFFGGPPRQTQLWSAVFGVSAFVIFPLTLRAMLAFPERGPPRAHGAAAWTWLFALYGVGATSWVFGLPFGPETGVRWSAAVNVTACIAILAVLTHGYRRAEAIGRRQLRWIVYGFYVGALPVLIGSLVPVASPGSWWLHEIMMSAVVLIPVCVVIAVVRYELFDVDRLISTTASYNVLLVLFVGAGLVLVPRVAEAASTWLGLDRSVGQVALSLGLAALAVPTHRLLHPRIERLFFAERHAFELGMQRLLTELSGSRDPRDLTQRLGERLEALIRPESCAIYVREGDQFTPVFARGPGVPPGFPAASRLAACLAAHGHPLAAERFAAGPGSGVSAPDRAALAALGAEVVVPVRRGEELTAFVALGTRRSGDVYTSTDVALLAALADKVTSELERFDERQILRQARAMEETLRRYVPGAIAERLAAGDDLEADEREVTVLFVDIRGYATYAEGRRAREIFSTVNRYTQAVSEIVRRHGGSVVEFNGDGMMAVFGAPQALTDKERAGVRAGREIVVAVAALPVEGAAPDALSVGVGIATGNAFVGNVQAVDRLIWSALGNTTNLAARLQALTRELHAAVVIDAATWRRAGDAGRDFTKHERVTIRGRSRMEDLFVLPLGAR